LRVIRLSAAFRTNSASSPGKANGRTRVRFTYPGYAGWITSQRETMTFATAI